MLRLMLLTAIVASAIPLGAAAQGVPDFAAIVAAPDRSEGDRATDGRRDPVKLFGFTGVRLGMTVLDMGAGGGYSTELMARAVGPAGKVFGQNAANFERAVTALDARTKTPAGRNIAPLVRPFDDPLPPEQRDLDFITYSFFYHDTAYLTVDRAEMDRKMFAALKPGLSMTGYDPQRSMRISQPRSCRRNQTVGLGVPAPKSIIGEPRASPPSINFILSRKVRLLFQ